MSANPEITDRLANRLKEERKAKGLSLEALASLSGVSRSMLSQIERGESSPTVASLWNLTQALKIDFSALLDEEKASNGPVLDLVRAEQAPVIHKKTQGYSIKILSAPTDVGDTEIYDVRFEPGGEMDSAPHNKGCIEQLTVLSGRLSITSEDDTVEVGEGDTIRYMADLPHAIRATADARALLIVKNA